MKALALVESPRHVCCRYRVRAFEPALNRAGWSLEVQGLARGSMPRLAQLGRSAGYDAVLLQRKLLPAWQLKALRKRARRLIYDFDDAVLYRDSYDPRGPFDIRRASRFVRTVGLADLVIAGNDYLAEAAEAAGAKPERIRVIPTCIDPTRYDAPTPADVPPEPSDRLMLTWIGSSSTLNGLERRRATLEAVGAAVPAARLRMICDRFADFDPLPVDRIAWSEAGEAAELALADAGISLIPDDRWSRGKCGLKVLQYGASGLPTVANPVGVHPVMIEDGTTGFLADSPSEWVEAIQTLAADPDLRRRMGDAARSKVLRDYAVEAWSGPFLAAVAGIEPLAPPKARTPHSNSPASRTKSV